MNELIKIEKPQLPEKWDYDISVQKIKEIFANWKKKNSIKNRIITLP